MGEEKPKSDPHRWLELLAYCVPYLAANLSGFSVGAMFGALTASFGLTASQIGVLGTTCYIGTLIFTLPASLIISRWDLRKTMTALFILMAASGVAQAFATGFMDLLIYRLINAFAAAAVTPFYGIIKSRWFPQEDFALAAGIESGVGMNLGQIIGVAGTPIIMGTMGWQGTFLVGGVVAVIGALMWLMFGRSYPKPGYIGSKIDVKAKVEKKALSVTDTFRRVIKYREVWLVPLTWWGTTGIWMCMFTYWPAFVKQTYGLDYTTAGFILSLLPVGSLVASLVAGVLSRKVGLNKPFITIPTILVCLAYFGMLCFSNPFALSMSSFLAGFGAFIFVPAGMATISTLPDETPEMAGMALSIFVMIITGIGGVAVPIIAGMLIDAGWSMYNAMLIFVPAPALLGIASILFRETGPKAKWRQVKE